MDLIPNFLYSIIFYQSICCTLFYNDTIICDKNFYFNQKKLLLLISYVAIIGISALVVFSGDTIYPNVIQIDPSKFFIGLATFGPLLRYDFLLLMTILPIVVGLTLLAKNSFKETDSILFLILGTLLAGPILIMFTNFYEILPYRYIPLIVFFAIGIGMFFSKNLFLNNSPLNFGCISFFHLN